ncbi:MAG: hypothetical protein LBU51_02470 [Bacteroidales bacterium]|jgi:hypothetical protein|nr:hypothetical protein [Bacteroidales bacterium]
MGSGTNQNQAPDYKFVQDFLLAYNYNIGNGGGDNLRELAKAYLTDPTAFINRSGTTDKSYDNKEERRVITGSEAKTAQANGEYPKGYTRTDHNHYKSIRVSNPTKTTPMPETPPVQQQSPKPSLMERLMEWWNKFLIILVALLPFITCNRREE